jgi:hypothetical protein
VPATQLGISGNSFNKTYFTKRGETELYPQISPPPQNIIENFLCHTGIYRGADKSLARHTSRCILFDG